MKEDMRLSPSNCGRVLLTCIILHNFCINCGMGYFDVVEPGVNGGSFVVTDGGDDVDDEDYSSQEIFT